MLDPRELGRRERRVLSPRGFLPPGEKAFESSSNRSVRTQRFPPGLRRSGGARARPSGCRVLLPARSSGAPRATKTGAAGSEGSGGGTAGPGTRVRAGGAGALPSGFARHRSHRRSARLGLSIIVSGRSRAASPPGPRPPGGPALPPVPSFRRLWGERWGGAEGEAARSPAAANPQLPGCNDAVASARFLLIPASPGPDVSPFGVSRPPRGK